MSKVMKNKNISINVNMCWEQDQKRQCQIMSKEDAYKTKRWLDTNNGSCYWFQALDS